MASGEGGVTIIVIIALKTIELKTIKLKVIELDAKGRIERAARSLGF